MRRTNEDNPIYLGPELLSMNHQGGAYYKDTHTVPDEVDLLAVLFVGVNDDVSQCICRCAHGLAPVVREMHAAAEILRRRHRFAEWSIRQVYGPRHDIRIFIDVALAIVCKF